MLLSTELIMMLVPLLCVRRVGAFTSRSVSSPLVFGSRATAFRPTRTLASSSSSVDEDNESKKNEPQQQRQPMDWTTDAVRETFLTYFEQEHDHVRVASSPCAPLNDPTLLFTNAGMNQFKPVFLGQVDPNSALAGIQRAVNAQKCIRAGGKHNDLEDVGRDTYHHTFFEMLGSWSFGNYFKKEAIDWAWQLLTVNYQLDPERLYATYFKGDDQVEADLEARDYWLQYLPASRVIGCAARDNFWEMGETGPCGPCSEIHYDRIGGGRDASDLVNADDPNVMEIWNLVFIQYNRAGPTELQTLPAQHVDTGMGLERLVSILQDKTSNYDIDCFQPLFEKLATLSPVGPYGGLVGKDDVTLRDTAYRAIADHARTLSFAIADGALPNNEGRGYVLRRILRRAVRYGQQMLECETGFFSQLIPVVVDTFGTAYPELVTAQDQIIQVVAEEEQAFSTMLDRGIKYFEDLQGELKESDQTVVSGEKAFYLYDTLGFPVDLTQLMAEEAAMTVDVAGFEEAMETQKERSRQAQRAAKSGGDGVVLELIAKQTAWLADQEIHPTDDSFKYKPDGSLPATVMAIYTAAGFLTDRPAEEGDFVGLVLDKSSFYPEAGGQVADTGVIAFYGDDDYDTVVGQLEVTDVQVYAGYLLHTGVVTNGSVTVGQAVQTQVDYERRNLTVPNHSMTHVLNAGLRKVLGDTVEQRGSLCNPEKLRFDFSHKAALKLDQLKAVERYCQDCIENADDVTSQVLPLEEAKAIDGVRAVFGEVYPDPVRVITIGDDTSVEFCGGTHLQNTAQAEAFCLVEETAVAKGIRRITAVTKETATEAIRAGAEFEARVETAEQLAAETEDLDKQAGAIRKDLDAAFMSASLKAELRERIEGIQKKAQEAKKKALQQRLDVVLNDVKKQLQDAADKDVLVLNVDIAADAKASQRVLNAVKEIAPEMAFLGLTEEEPGSGGKLMAFCLVPEALVKAGFKADDWIRATLEVCGGRGGGKPGNAQGQAPECSDVEAVVAAAEEFAAQKLEAKVV